MGNLWPLSLIPLSKNHLCLGHKEKETALPVTSTKPQLCLTHQNPTALHTTNRKWRCWKHSTWRQQKIHNSTQISQRAVFCFYCLFFLIHSIAFVQIPLLSWQKQCSLCLLTHQASILQEGPQTLVAKQNPMRAWLKLRFSQHNLIPLWQQPHA